MELQLDNDTTLILPERSEDAISEGLRLLTKILDEKKLSDAGGFGLGGEFGYGTNFENDIFLIHRFCWCERDNCPWCAGCECPESSFHYFVDENEVSFFAWMDYYDKRVPKTENLDWENISTEVNSHRFERHDPVCDFCLGKGISAQYGGASKDKMGAPNFWHKSSGLRVWWYKWIGRDMKCESLGGDWIQWNNILKTCIDSVQT